MNAHERVYRSLLVLYPRDHRHEYAEPMTQLVRDRLRDEGGGVRTPIVWGQIVLDLARSALAERKVTTMDTFKTGWWRVSAAVIAFGITFLGIGNMFGGDPGPYSGKVLAAAVAVAAGVLILVGLKIRDRRRTLGSTMVGVGTLPGATLIMVFWFPPVALFGLLSLFTAVFAFADAMQRDRIAGATG